MIGSRRKTNIASVMHVAFKCLCLVSMPRDSVPAQVGTGPIASPPVSSIPIPVDHSFPGVIHLDVDATDTDRGVFRIKESIPVQSLGEAILFYPEWETTSHSATATAVELAGLRVEVDGREQSWWRDSLNVHAFHVLAPSSAHALMVRFDYLPRAVGEVRPEMIDVQWQRLLLYPAGWYARDIPVSATLCLPDDLHAFTALTVARSEAVLNSSNHLLTFAPEMLDRLIDAPVYAGRYVQQEDLSSAGQPPVHLDLLADVEADLAIKPEILAQLRALITQTGAVFGHPPFSRYEMIASLSDELSPGGGLEHLEEGGNNLPAHFLRDYAHQLGNRDLIAHEYVHAWNGRYRQPANLWSPTFNQPTDPSLLWVYEGQTEFWGRVLAVRAGMRSYQETLDKLALDAALVANRPGREWKNLADSTLDALYMPGHSPEWRDWQRREDYYPEGVLLWLDVDARLRELSAGRMGLDQFAIRFFAAHGHSEATSTYTFDDVCITLNELAPDDWKEFLNRHLLTHNTADAMAGLARAGWRLTYASIPTETFRQEEEEAGVTDVSTSVGLQVRDDGTIRSVVWNGPAFQAGIAPGAKVSKVNGQPFTAAGLLAAIQASAQVPIRLSVQVGANERQLTIPYFRTA